LKEIAFGFSTFGFLDLGFEEGGEAVIGIEGVI
jgi:hypothetical protein